MVYKMQLCLLFSRFYISTFPLEIIENMKLSMKVFLDTVNVVIDVKKVKIVLSICHEELVFVFYDIDI